MRVLLTGATGLIGSHLAEALADRGEEVVCLLRRKPESTWLKGLKVIPVRGDLTEPASLAPALRGVELVFHLAGQVRGWDFDKVNARGTANLVAAVREQAPGLKGFIFTSSIAAQGPSPEERPLTEEDPPRPVSTYGRSKLAAEEAVLELADLAPVTIIRPAPVYGPRDTSFLSLFKLLKRGLDLGPLKPEQKVSLIHVSDVVQALLRAAEVPARTDRRLYLVSDGQAYSPGQVTALAAQVMGLRPRRFNPPQVLVLLAAMIGEMAGRLTGRPSIIGLDKYIEAVQAGWWLSPARAVKELGFRPKFDLASGLALTIDWYKAHKWL